MPESESVRLIGITGAPCTGKSTVLSEFEHEISETATAREQARLLLVGVPPAERASFYLQVVIGNAIRAEEARAADGSGVVLCDRTVADGLAYLSIAGKPADTERYFAHIEAWLPDYERFIICSPEGIPYRQDSVRTEPPEFRPAIHQEFITVFETFGIQYELLEGTREQRRARIAEIAHPAHD